MATFGDRPVTVRLLFKSGRVEHFSLGCIKSFIVVITGNRQYRFGLTNDLFNGKFPVYQEISTMEIS